MDRGHLLSSERHASASPILRVDGGLAGLVIAEQLTRNPLVCVIMPSEAGLDLSLNPVLLLQNLEYVWLKWWIIIVSQKTVGVTDIE